MEDRIVRYKEDETSRTVSVRETDHEIDIRTVGDIEPFLKMRDRRIAVPPEKVALGVRSPGGFEFTNMGISGAFTFPHKGREYLLLTYHPGKKLGKLISGYLDGEDVPAPRKALLHGELAEELLIVPDTDRREIVPIEIEGKAINPYPDYFALARGIVRLRRPPKFSFPGKRKPISLDGALLKDAPTIYHSPATKSTQLVWGYGLAPEGFDSSNLTLWHTEDQRFSNIGDPTKPLRTLLHEDGILAIQLDVNGKLTDNIGNIKRGRLEQIDPREVVLSEAFAVDDDGISRVPSIKFLDYLAKQ